MNQNVLKGMLIILVVADHNDFTRSLFPGFFLGLTFHVVGFMTIPFLRAPEPVLTRRFADYAFRLYWPFLLVTVALWSLLTVMGSAPLIDRIGMLLLALYSGNAMLLKEVTHMGLLWFLPSFISMVAIRNMIDTARPAVRHLALLMLSLVHLVIGTYAMAVQDYLPLGLLPALYMIPLAYMIVLLHRRLFERWPVGRALALSAVVFVAVKALQMHLGVRNEVGFSAVADWRDPLALLVNDLEAVSGTLLLFQIARLKFEGLLAACGKYSMQIYLFHAFVALGFYKLALWLAPSLSVAILFSATLAATVVTTLAASMVLTRIPLLRRAIFPQHPGDLPRP